MSPPLTPPALTEDFHKKVFGTLLNEHSSNKEKSTLAATAKATTTMNSKAIVHLLLVFSLFYSCLPAPKHFLVETEAKGKKDIGNKQVVGSFKILQNSL